jgi:hypothetical protein
VFARNLKNGSQDTRGRAVNKDIQCTTNSVDLFEYPADLCFIFEIRLKEMYRRSQGRCLLRCLLCRRTILVKVDKQVRFGLGKAKRDGLSYTSRPP